MNAALRLPRAAGGEDSSTWTLAACVAAALALHGACALALRAAPERAPARAPLTTEVELAPAPPPAVVQAAPATPPPAPPPRPARPRATSAEAPAPARAGALLTAPEDPAPAAQEEPVRFVTDAEGHGYGHGSVARGGTAEHAAGDPEALRPAAAAPTPAARLSREPVLLSSGCNEHFPGSARRDHGTVTAIATVRANGSVARLEIGSESPAGHGFGAAARACLANQRWTPALDERGRPTLARTRVVVRFTR